MGPELASGVSAIAQYLGSGWFIGDQTGSNDGVTFVAWPDVIRGDQPRFGLRGDMAFEAVAVSPTGFVSMARFGINGGDHPILRYPLRDTPLARPRGAA